MPHDHKDHIEHIRSRPGMYIGGCSSAGLGMMIGFLIDDALAETGAPVTRVQISLEGDDFASVELSGRFPPIGQLDHIETLVRLPLSLLVCIAMSESAHLDYMQAEESWTQSFLQGRATTERQRAPVNASPKLRLRFKRDPVLFSKQARLGFFRCCGLLQEKAIFHPQISMTVVDLPSGRRREYSYPNGLADHFDELCYDWRRRTDDPAIHLRLAEGDYAAEALISNRGGDRAELHLFANGNRFHGGTPLLGMRRGVSTALRETRQRFEINRAMDGRFILLSVRFPDGEWESSTKDWVGNKKVGDLVCRMITEQWPRDAKADLG